MTQDASRNQTTTLYLLRHGATASNERKPYVLQGHSVDHALSETGRRQAAAVAGFLSDFHFDAVYSSRMKRAIETAEAVARPHGLTNEPVDDLQECDVGRWEGLGWEAVMRDYPDEHRRFIADAGENPYLDGESYGDVLRRVQPVFDGLLNRHSGETILVVAHNVVNRVYLAALMGLELRLARKLRQSNTGVNVVRAEGDDVELITMNADFHLRDL